MTELDAVLSSMVRFGTPLLLAALGGITTRWTRDLNIGLEGAVLAGAFFGVFFGFQTGSSLVAVGIVAALGFACGLAFGAAVVVARANPFVVGTAVNVLAIGGTVFLLRSQFGVKGSFIDPGIPALPVIDIPALDGVPVLGALFSGHTALTWLAFVLVAALAWAVRATTIVRHLKASGEFPEALATAGGRVRTLRVVAQGWCFALCFVAGAQLSLGQLRLFTEGMTNGLGFVALAAVIFAAGHPLVLAGVCGLFGLAFAVSVRVDPDVVAPQFAQMLPYVVTLASLVVVSYRRRREPDRLLTSTDDL